MHKEDKEEEEEKLKGPSCPARLLNSDFEQVPCSIFADHRQSGWCN
jgi:hypothetical protein